MPERIKILKIGIKDDMMAQYGVDPQRIDEWLKRWTGSVWYLAAVARKRHRHDLEGNDVERIRDKHRKHALAELRRMKKPTLH